jgi:hypothetical protein
VWFEEPHSTRWRSARAPGEFLHDLGVAGAGDAGVWIVGPNDTPQALDLLDEIRHRPGIFFVIRVIPKLNALGGLRLGAGGLSPCLIRTEQPEPQGHAMVSCASQSTCTFEIWVGLRHFHLSSQASWCLSFVK